MRPKAEAKLKVHVSNAKNRRGLTTFEVGLGFLQI